MTKDEIISAMIQAAETVYGQEASQEDVEALYDDMESYMLFAEFARIVIGRQNNTVYQD